MSMPHKKEKGSTNRRVRNLAYILAGITAGAFLVFGISAHAQVSGSLWKLSANSLFPVNSTWSVTIPQLGGGGTQCLQVTNTGLLQVSGGACGGGGSSFGQDFNFVQGTPNYLIGTTSPLGLIMTASSTIGDGTATGGLTISGNATTTGSIAVQGTGTSTIAGRLLVDTNSVIFTSGGSVAAFAQKQNANLTNYALAQTAGGHTHLNATGVGGIGFHIDGAAAELGTINYSGWDFATTSIFSSGNVGIATTSPFARLSVHANPNDSSIAKILFAIGSSTNSATTTLFKIDNTGAITTSLGTGCVTSTSGLLSVGSTCGTVTSVTGTYPVQSTGGATPVISLAFGTTTSNTWAGLQTFTNASSTLFSTGYGSTTNAYIGTLNLPNISGTQCLHSISGVVSGTGSDCGSGTGAINLVGTSSAETAGRIPFWTTTAATPALLSGGSSNFTWDNTNNLLTVTGNASTTNLSASGSFYVATHRIIDNALGGFAFQPTIGSTVLQVSPTNITSTVSLLNNNVATARIGWGTTTPAWSVQIAFSTGPQLALSDGSLTSNHWTFRNTNGNFYIATASPSTFATSTSPALSIDTNGQVTLSRALGVVSGGTGNTTFTSSQLLYGNGTAALSSVATATPLLGLGLSGTLTTIANVSQTLSIATSSLYTGSTGQISYFSGANALIGTSTITIDTNSFVGVGSTSPKFQLGINAAAGQSPWAVGSTTNTLAWIDNLGKFWLWDVINKWAGIVSPTRSFVLSTATSTTWTATSTGAYAPSLTMPFAGTIKQARCTASSTQAFLGTAVYVNTSLATPNYFISSSTIGVEKFTAGNTFNAGDTVTTYFGTSTTDANAKSVSCTFDVIQTS